MTSWRSRALAVAVAMVVWPWVAWSAEGDPGGTVDIDCDPEVYEAMAESARVGVEQDLVVIRHPEQGIRDPQSILDFSCLEGMFDFHRFNILFDPQRGIRDLLGLVQRRVCSVARDAYWQYVGRPMDRAVYTAELPRLPGLSMRRYRTNLLREDGGRFRRLLGGAPE